MTRLFALVAATIGMVVVSAAQTPITQRPDPKTVRLRGGRFKPLSYDVMTPAQ
jgi:hypothetical protein